MREINLLYKQQQFKDLVDNDFIIAYENENLSAIIKAPYSSVYRHKFIRLDFEIPRDYPHSPPKVLFKNYDGVRIHPNMYEDGKCCATILNTWGDNIYEKWTSSMGIENILVMFHSFLDNNPYKYEPGGRDDPSYSIYVQYQSWTTCLINYLIRETIPEFKKYIYDYILLNIDQINKDLNELKEMYPTGSYYTRCFEIFDYTINYSKVIDKLQDCYSCIEYNSYFEDDLEYNLFDLKDTNYSCNICYDTFEDVETIELDCGHIFHKECCKLHVKNNNKLCSMCRTDITDDKILLLEINNEEPPEYIINPQTNRRIKVGGKVWKSLINEGVI